MFNLILHTALLVLAAFILGAIIGCLLKRFFAGGSVYGSASRPTPAQSAAAAAAATVASRTGGGEPDPSAEEAAAAKAAEEAAAAKAAEEAAAAKAAEEAAAAKATEEAAAAKAAEEAAAAKAEEEAAAAKAAEEAAAAKAAEEAAAKAEQEAEAAQAKETAQSTESMDDTAAAAAIAALPADATNEDKANAVGTRPEGLAAPIGGKKDNLQRIKGIGKVNEAKLNDLGIYHFSQIRDWSASEARWVGTFLAFIGRIEREDWIGQARVLAGGGETEFAKRVDKGDVSTSDNKT